MDTVYLGRWPREVFDRLELFDKQLVRSKDDEVNLRLTQGRMGKQSPRIESWYTRRESYVHVLITLPKKRALDSHLQLTYVTAGFCTEVL
jgi:hypothetical protein